MKDIWVISDTHFAHANILKFMDSRTGKPVRPGFDSVEHMNEHMIEKWNSVVKQGDIVYHLGDVVMGNKDWMHKNFNRLNGSKRLVVGNHDTISFLSRGGWFKKVMMWRMFPEYGLIFSHVPLHISSMYRHSLGKPLYGIHGHIHQNSSPEGPYRNVCVEVIDYTPIHIEDLALEATNYFNSDQWIGYKSKYKV